LAGGSPMPAAFVILKSLSKCPWISVPLPPTAASIEKGPEFATRAWRDVSYGVALKRLCSIAAGFSLRLHRLESLCY